MRDFNNKVAVITGAGSGIGRALAVSLAKRGVRLAISDINSESVGATAQVCLELGARVRSYRLDVADRDAAYSHAVSVREEFGGVNLVINNAGVALDAPVLDMRWQDFDWLMGINFGGVANGTKAFLDDLIASGDGHLVNISSSVFGLVGIPSQSAYNAAKFAVRGFTESLRQEMIIGGFPVGVTCVYPGGIKTNIVAHGRGTGNTRVEREEAHKHFQKIAVTSPEGAAKAIIRGIEKNKPRVLIGPGARLFDAIPRLVGPRYEDVLAWASKRSPRSAEMAGSPSTPSGVEARV